MKIIFRSGNSRKKSFLLLLPVFCFYFLVSSTITCWLLFRACGGSREREEERTKTYYFSVHSNRWFYGNGISINIYMPNGRARWQSEPPTDEFSINHKTLCPRSPFQSSGHPSKTLYVIEFITSSSNDLESEKAKWFGYLIKRRAAETFTAHSGTSSK